MLKEGIKVSIITAMGNVFLAFFKLIAGIIGNSHALLSDAVHSIADVFSAIVVIIGLKLASKKEDHAHPYGHERFESIAAFILSLFLLVVGISIGIVGVKTIFYNDYSTIKTPNFIALIAAIISIIIKEAMYWYTIITAKRIHSDSLKADAWHHRSDALSSIGSLIGIGGSMIGLKLLDPIASIIIGFFIIKVACSIFKDSVNKVIDRSCDDDFIEKMKEIILNTEGVNNIDSIKTRLFGSKVYVEVEIGACGDIMLNEAHIITNMIQSNISNEYNNIKKCMIYINPK